MKTDTLFAVIHKSCFDINVKNLISGRSRLYSNHSRKLVLSRNPWDIKLDGKANVYILTPDKQETSDLEFCIDMDLAK